MAPDTRGDGGVEADTRREAGVPVRTDHRRRRHRRLPRLDLQPVCAPHRDELAGALEVVVDAVDGRQMRVATRRRRAAGRGGAEALQAHYLWIAGETSRKSGRHRARDRMPENRSAVPRIIGRQVREMAGQSCEVAATARS